MSASVDADSEALRVAFYNFVHSSIGTQFLRGVALTAEGKEELVRGVEAIIIALQPFHATRLAVLAWGRSSRR